ncbi:hypothetical protein BAE44_0006916 [Dichanthelium oligosanthes]|uniref:Protein LURP-one-related 15 n=1 Tax=Dichanthelium oligosanthes TaxID=888268 RepID=A0A1E5W3W2_9POAL|nr:hypothetical protein BAE44_0006916 [Dichanthelium oligosanthes]
MDAPPAPATAAAEAPPAPAPAVTAVVDARFCAPEATAFAVAKTITSSLSGRAFTVTDATGGAVMKAPDFAIQGSYYDGACAVYQGNSDAAIAKITRRNTGALVGLGRDIYAARINPGIDRAFIFALTVILDEMH